MRKALVKIHNKRAGILTEDNLQHYIFEYDEGYKGSPISLTMPVQGGAVYKYDKFPAFFDGLLPEGIQLTGLLKRNKIDANDLFSQLLIVGEDTVGAVTIEHINSTDE